jgi:hypothetical protein
VAILDRQTGVIIENKFGLTEILKVRVLLFIYYLFLQHINDLSMHIDVEETLSSAEAIYHQLAASQDKLPTHVSDILGFDCHHSTSVVNSAESSPVRQMKGV